MHREHSAIMAVMAAWLISILLSGASWAISIEALDISSVNASLSPNELAYRIHVYANVTTPTGDPIRGLTASDFTLIQDGQPIIIEALSHDQRALSTVWVIDNCSSLKTLSSGTQQALSEIKKAALRFHYLAGTAGWTAIYAFKPEPAMQLDFESSRESFKEALDAMSIIEDPSVCLYGAVYRALKKVSAVPQSHRRAIMLLTASRYLSTADEACSGYTANQLIEASAQEKDPASIYSIVLGPDADRQSLRYLARQTGGRLFTAERIDDIESTLIQAAKYLNTQYQITYTTRSLRSDHRLVLQVSDGWHKCRDEKKFRVPALHAVRPPIVQFSEPLPPESIQGTVPVRLALSNADSIDRVRYYEDGVLKAEYTGDPRKTYLWDTSRLGAGYHVLRAEVVDSKGQSGYDELARRILKSPAPKRNPAFQGKRNTDAGKGPMVLVGISFFMLVLLVLLMFRRHGKDRRPTEAAHQLSDEKPPLVEPIASDELKEPKELEAPGTEEALPAGEVDTETKMVTDWQEEKRTVKLRKQFSPIALLRVIHSPGLTDGHTFEVSQKTSIGRNKDNDIRLPDEKISRHHAKIRLKNNEFYIKDLGSRNGTIVDQENIGSKSVRLRDGNKISLSSETVLVFHLTHIRETLIPQARIKVIRSPSLDPGESFNLYSHTTIGRSPENDLSLQDESISRKHAKIFLDDTVFYLQDFGSRNGTLIDSRKVFLDIQPLADDAHIELSMDTVLSFHTTSEDDRQTFEARLEVVQSPGLTAGQQFAVFNHATIGRSKTNEVYIPDELVSRRHAKIALEKELYYLTDLGSLNGSIVDQHRISRESILLKDGAEIQLSSESYFIFHLISALKTDRQQQHQEESEKK